jgi:SAM-dependent methyltransferase
MTAHYDDPTFDYDRYWQGREYEHQSEVLALSRFFKKCSRFRTAADIGGGYGRLTAYLAPVSEKIYLIEPSQKQLRLAKSYLKGLKNITLSAKTVEKTGLPDKSLDLVLVVRVMHHLPDPNVAIAEINRILKPGGTLILEFANSLHFKARVTSFFSGQPILPTPLDKRSAASIRRHTIAFVNHHPDSVFKLLTKNGFTVDQTLSVSNFRSPFLKKYLPLSLLLSLENLFQSPLAKLLFGPSIFILAHKT